MDTKPGGEMDGGHRPRGQKEGRGEGGRRLLLDCTQTIYLRASPTRWSGTMLHLTACLTPRAVCSCPAQLHTWHLTALHDAASLPTHCFLWQNICCCSQSYGNTRQTCGCCSCVSAVGCIGNCIGNSIGISTGWTGFLVAEAAFQPQ